MGKETKQTQYKVITLLKLIHHYLPNKHLQQQDNRNISLTQNRIQYSIRYRSKTKTINTCPCSDTRSIDERQMLTVIVGALVDRKLRRSCVVCRRIVKVKVGGVRETEHVRDLVQRRAELTVSVRRVELQRSRRKVQIAGDRTTRLLVVCTRRRERQRLRFRVARNRSRRNKQHQIGIQNSIIILNISINILILFHI